MTIASSSLLSPPDARASRRALWMWSSLIIGLLVLQVGLCFVGVYCATRVGAGKNAVVEADYYNKALHWDQKQALLRASRELGWGVDLTVGDVATTQGARALMLKLADAQGVAISDAEVQVAFFHHARPLELRQVELKTSGAGTYANSLPLDRRGIWEFRLTIHRGGKIYVETIERELL
jgi:nitrogen fixation protein FixH